MGKRKGFLFWAILFLLYPSSVWLVAMLWTEPTTGQRGSVDTVESHSIDHYFIRFCPTCNTPLLDGSTVTLASDLNATITTEPSDFVSTGTGYRSFSSPPTSGTVTIRFEDDTTVSMKWQNVYLPSAEISSDFSLFPPLFYELAILKRRVEELERKYRMMLVRRATTKKGAKHDGHPER